MSFKDIWTLAFRNLKAGRKNVYKIIFGMGCACTLVYCYIAVICYFNDYKKNFDESYQNSCYCFYEETEGEKVEKVYDLMDRVNAHMEACDADMAGVFLDICPNYVEDFIYVDDMVISINEKAYPVKSYFIYNREFYQNISSAFARIDIGYYKNEFNVFPKHLYGDNANITYIGEPPSNPGEIMLDDHILKVYGIDAEDEALIGADITLMNKGDIICEDYVVSGIYKSKDLSLREAEDSHDYHLEHIYINLKQEDESRFRISYGSSYRLYYKNYSEFISNYKYADNILNMQFDCDIYENIEYLPTKRGMEICVLSWFMKNIGRLLIIMASVIALVIMFSLFYIIQFYFGRNVIYMEMLNCIGMSKKDRRKLGNLEMLLMAVGAIVIAVYISILFFIIFKYITYKLLSYGFELNIPVFLLSILASAVLIWGYKSVIIRL
ncbi:MAG: FtsX-like permease family protein [Butyrivibrio sp.]